MHKPNLDPVLRASRRSFLKCTAAASAFALAPIANAAAEVGADTLPPAFSGLKPLGSRVHPITADEFHERLRHGQRLMSEIAPKFDALFFAPGTSLYYFTGIRWGVSERLLGLMVPRMGAPVLVVPAFEEGRLRGVNCACPRLRPPLPTGQDGEFQCGRLSRALRQLASFSSLE